MVRPRYPSDEARVKSRPHVQVHLSARTHRIMGPAFAEVVDRGVIAGLWMVAFQAHATATGDIVTLTYSDLCWIAGRQRPPAAAQLLARVCARVGYRIWFHSRTGPVPSWHQLRTELARSPCEPGASPVPVPCQFGAVSVHVRNLLKKQITNSATRGAAPRPSEPSDTPNTDTPNTDTEDRERESEEARKEEASAAPQPEALSLSSAIADATGWSREQADVWLEANGAHARAEVEANPPRGELGAAVRAKLLRWAKAEKKPPRFRPSATATRGEPNAQRALARKRLAYRGIESPSEEQIRMEFEQFEFLGGYVPPNTTTENGGKDGRRRDAHRNPAVHAHRRRAAGKGG